LRERAPVRSRALYPQTTSSPDDVVGKLLGDRNCAPIARTVGADGYRLQWFPERADEHDRVRIFVTVDAGDDSHEPISLRLEDSKPVKRY